MKKNFLFTVMALFMTLFAASCSQEEIISDNNSKEGGTVSVAVNIPVNNPVTRAVPNIPEGYKLRCILQLVNSSGKDIENGRYVQEVAAGSEKVTFTFNAPSEAYKCLFWADYVKEGATDVATDNIYDTADLKAIGYTTNAGNEMFKGDVADAFYACSPEPVNGSGALTSITMERPFTKITFKGGQSTYADYTKIIIKDLPAPTGFNVMSGETAGYTGKGNYESSKISSSELAVENGKWFSAYLFASSNKESLGTGNDIVFELKKDNGDTSGELKLNGESITLTENVEVEATVEPQKKGDTSIDVIFPDEMNDATKPKVGQFLYKDGTWGDEFQTDKTIGIVFATKNNSITDNSNYGDSYTGKEIAGYAMAITSVTKGAIKTGTNFVPVNIYGNDAWTAGDYNGYQYTQTNWNVGTYGEGTIFNFAAWKNSNSIPEKTTNLSPWYIPSARQLLDIIGLTWGYEGDADQSVAAITKNDALYTAYTTALTNGGTALPGKENSNMISSYVVDDTGATAGFQTVKIEVLDGEKAFNKIFKVNSGNSVSTRPVLTIFKAE